MTSQVVPEAVAAGHGALADGAWHRARELFQSALADGDCAEAWEGLGWAGWWLHDADLAIRAREAAYRAHRAQGDATGAARVAAWLASDHREARGDEAVGKGWLVRAHRLLDGRAECPEHGWLALHEGSFALSDGDTARAARGGRLAAGVGRRHGVADLEAVGLAQEGIALVVRGDVAAGMERLDEASAIARAEPLRLPVSLAWALCYLVSACEGIGDFPRAIQWCEAMREVADRWRGRQILGVCRTSYGRILATRGDWPGAESELTAAVGDLVAARPGAAGTGFVRLAELRARQGRDGEARELFARAGAHPEAIVGLGELALDQGDAVSAREAADRVLRRLPADSVLDRLPPLELRGRALAALGDLEGAEAPRREVERAAARAGTPYLRGRAHRLAAELGAARGDAEQARCDAEDAVDCFTAGAAPYDAARARLILAAALAALGRPERAAAEAGAAREAFATLGAARDVARAEALLAARAPEPAPDRALGDLTVREVEVLRLVAQGSSDADIAERLVVSPHTVHRHVANIRAKLRLPSRAAAVAHASRAGLL
ncbi:MAG: hypothetical protein QOC64_630 [Solirubrobacteraceae bacterium]|nr:hypothetical protein [Solirubrobacteraceae bacterium]